MEIQNSMFIVTDENAGLFGLGATVARIDDGLVVAEKVLYGEQLNAVNRHVWAKVSGDEKQILETYKKLPKAMK